MTRIDDELLLGFLTGTLEPGRSLEVEEELKASAALRVRLSALSAESRARPAVASPWRVPPPGVLRGREAPRPHLELPLHLGPEGLRPGEAFGVRMEPVADADLRRVVVLYRGRDGWRVASPLADDEDARLSEIPPEPDGSRVLTLVTGPEVGAQRWAVVLPIADTPIAWDLPEEDRWTWLQEAVRAGSAPVFSVEVEVSAP